MHFSITGMAKALLLAAISVAAPIAVRAQSDIKTERVQFAKGSTSTVINRTIKGRQTIDFVVNARQGQALAAKLTSKSTAVYFNIIAPGETDVAFYVGDTYPANDYRGSIPKTGDVKFRVYLNRAAARRGESATFSLKISVGGSGAKATQLPAKAGAALPIRGKGGLEEKCLARVGKDTGARVIGTNRIEEVESVVDVHVNIQGAEAPWRCRIRRDGTIDSIMYTGDEGAA